VTASLIALLAAAGFFAGLVDAIAGGGGLITLPALLAAGLPPHVALGTNKGQAVFGAVSSATSFARRGWIDRDRAAPAFACAFAGSLLGAFAQLALRPATLRPLVIVLLVAAAAIVAWPRKLRGEPGVPVPRAAMWGAVVALGLGFYDGFFGPGTGTMLLVAFVLLFGDTLTRASGNAKVANLASNIAALILFSLRGTIEWRIALPMAAANALGAALGARLAVARGDRFVRAVVLVVVAALVVKLSLDLRAAR
jgi:uncharacterized membrane protein YfcA